MGIALLLHNIRSTHNVGSIFRTADAAGVSHIYLSGYTPQPIDRFGRPQKDIAKTALGAERTVPWSYRMSPATVVSALKKEGWEIVGVEQDAKAHDYRDHQTQKSTLLIFGNEVRGISDALKSQCDSLIEIPMQGAMLKERHHPRHVKKGKESLNVSVAAGIVLFSLASK